VTGVKDRLNSGHCFLGQRRVGWGGERLAKAGLLAKGFKAVLHAHREIIGRMSARSVKSHLSLYAAYAADGLDRWIVENDDRGLMEFLYWDEKVNVCIDDLNGRAYLAFGKDWGQIYKGRENE
jgi:hypothetical protein